MGKGRVRVYRDDSESSGVDEWDRVQQPPSARKPKKRAATGTAAADHVSSAGSSGGPKAVVIRGPYTTLTVDNTPGPLNPAQLGGQSSPLGIATAVPRFPGGVYRPRGPRTTMGWYASDPPPDPREPRP